jgi:catechol 2,3-dioxygenase-like lactoylglutathione lyase family enzyme
MARGNPFGHVDLRVTSMEEALPFYEALLPALGFTQRYHSEVWKVWAVTEPPLPATAYFGITESTGHTPNESRIAFWAADPAEVDRIAAVVRDAGGRDLSGPKPMPYGPDYYAVYFADPCGNRFEVYFRQLG